MEIALLLIGGLVLLALGGDFLVKGASGLALKAGISPLVVGLTVVAFGTSAPELVVSLQASFAGSPDIAIGNVVGSNILNVLLVLGICGLIMPLQVASQLVRREVPIMIAASIVFWAFAANRKIERWEGFAFFISLIVYLVWAIRLSRKESKDLNKAPQEKPLPAWLAIVYVILGLVALVFGADWFVNGSVQIAKSLGVSEAVIGLTIIAVGTSMPEIATSIVATIKGERDIAVGNMIGSNIFNILGIVGITAMVSPENLFVAASLLDFDLAFMTAVAVACLPIFFSYNFTITRLEGFLFLGYYVAYTAFLVFASTNPPLAEVLREWKIAFAVPLTVLVLLVMALREHKTN